MKFYTGISGNSPSKFELQFSSRTSIRLLYSNLIEIFAACLHPQTTLFLKFSFFSCNVQGHSDVIIFAIFRFFYFMISPPNRPFLAYLQKKIFPFKILWTCRFFSYNNFFSVQLTYKHPVAVFQSDRNLCSLFAPSDYAVFKIFIFFLQCSGSQ